MRFHPNELFILFDSTTSTGKQTRALAYSITKHVNEVNCYKTKFTSTIWKEILTRLNLRAKDLLNRAHPEYQEKIAGNSFDGLYFPLGTFLNAKFPSSSVTVFFPVS